MRVLFHVRRWLPMHPAGGEFYADEMARFLATRHEVRVAVLDCDHDFTRYGVEVRATRDQLERLRADYAWADLVVTQLDLSHAAAVEAKRANKPLVHLCHNQRSLRQFNIKPRETALVVWNSRWVRAAWVKESGRLFEPLSMVARPFVRLDDYQLTPSSDEPGAYTLVNLSWNKGAPTFYELARRLPDRRFVGHLGAYGDQLLNDERLHNVEIRPTGDLLPTFRETRVLLMPSEYESWGRTATEAGAAGIPTIAHPAPGLLESLGSAAVFALRDDVDDWETALLRFDDRGYYQHMRDYARARARHNESAALSELVQVEQRMKEIV